MKFKLFIACFTILSLLPSGIFTSPVFFHEEKQVQFNNHQVIRVIFDSSEQRELFESVQEKLQLDLWSEAVADHVDFRISPENKQQVFSELKGLKYKTVISNVQKLIDQETQHSEKHRTVYRQQLVSSSASSTKDNALTFENVFGDYQDAATYVKYLSSLPGSTLINIGNSYLNQSIQGVKFGRGPKNIVTHGGIHAREWITPAVVTYMAHNLINGKNSSLLLENFTFHVVPVLNVDGYAFTRNGNRMWRKNRQPNQGTSCIGTDPNRNFDMQWTGPRSSANPCTETYGGAKPFSAPETKAIADYISSLTDVVSYIDFHSYSQLWMFPWGYTCSDRIKEYDELNKASAQSVKALSSLSNTKYRYGDVCNIIYAASGSSIDWAYGVANVKFSFGIELRDLGRYGFLLPAKEIIPTGDETYLGVLELCYYLVDYLKRSQSSA